MLETNFPTVEIYFVYAFAFCKLRVYKEEETFARKVLMAHGSEFLEGDESKTWHEVDTRVLLNLLRESLPKILAKSTTEAISNTLGN